LSGCRVDDEPGPSSVRRAIERNSIALLSNHDRLSLDPPSPEWLGHSSDRLLVRHSGLWNQRHVDEAHDPAFLGYHARPDPPRPLQRRAATAAF
jgi:hypothetical protein